jgi:small subunit ribosomal protein S16
MPARMRLQRYGKKGMPFYHIVIADGRAPRDGKFIENIGTYNPLTKPATIEINFEKALDWLNKGVKPSDTVKAILTYKGVIYKNHLLKGVTKGALTPELAEAKFTAWLEEKQAKIDSKIKQKELDQKSQLKDRLTAEVKLNETRAAAIAQKLAKLAQKETAKAEEEVSEAEAETPVVVPVTEAPKVETPVDEAPAAENEPEPEA